VPWPISLVVKNGSKACATISFDMPVLDIDRSDAELLVAKQALELVRPIMLDQI
jgi:hypothetical protein